MKKTFKIIVPILLVVAILGSIGWYLFVYDRNFTRDVLIDQARKNDLKNNSEIASWFYNLAYNFSGQDEDVAIELANQYKADGNYTKAEVTLTNAIADGATAELYAALCKIYVEQDKLLDAVTMLDSVADPAIRSQLDAMRPAAPEASYPAGFYNEYIQLELTAESGKICYTTSGEYPSAVKDVYAQPFTLDAGETTVYAITVSSQGLVSSLATLNYTVGGVVELVEFADPAMEASIRELLGTRENDVLYTNDLWVITDFTVPQDAATLTDLSLLPYLKTLTISDKKLDSLECLSGMTQLEELKITGCSLSDGTLDSIAALPALKRLTLSSCGLSTIADLAEMKNLTYLDLSGNTLRNLDVLSGMIYLSEIDLSHNAVTSLSALEGLSGLQKLNICYNSVSNLTPLSSCPKLTWLDAGHNELGNLNGVETMTALTYLNVGYNSLYAVKQLASCTALTQLDISNNSISEIGALSSLTSLTHLDFSYNQVVILPNWPDDCALYSINGSHNALETLSALDKKEHLAYVYMDYNNLTSIDVLASCYKLVQVSVYGNAIPDVSALTKQSIIVNYDPTN